MAQYYFTVASLPQLFYDSDSFLTIEAFLAICDEQVNRRELAIINSAFQAEKSGDLSTSLRNKVIGRWIRWNAGLRADLAEMRAQSLGRDFIRDRAVEYITGTEPVAREAFNQESPLEAEEVIERARWGFLDDLEVGHHFDVEKLLVYLYRLIVLTRRADFAVERGTERFRFAYNEIGKDKIGENPEKTP